MNRLKKTPFFPQSDITFLVTLKVPFEHLLCHLTKKKPGCLNREKARKKKLGDRAAMVIWGILFS